MNPSVHTDDARFLELLERWLQGDFTRTDERELHALAEKDDFRKEAWEGFVALPEGRHEIHLEAIRRRLRPQPGSKRIPIGMWSAIAAVFLLLVFAIYFLPRISQKETAPLAENTAPVSPSAKDAVASMDSLGNEAVATDESAGISRAESLSKRYPGHQPAVGELTHDDVSFAESELPDLQKMGNQAPYATSAPPPAADTLPASVGGPASYQNVVTRPLEQAPALSKQPVELPVTDVVVKQASEDSDKPGRRAMESKKAKDVVLPAQTTPFGGWDNFRRYLRDNARLPDAARNNNISGYVQLQFEVGQNGRPFNHKIVRSLGYGCDEEAIRLVNSVSWTPGSAGPILLEVPFVR